MTSAEKSVRIKELEQEVEKFRKERDQANKLWHDSYSERSQKDQTIKFLQTLMLAMVGAKVELES